MYGSVALQQGPLSINARFRRGPQTGVQRVAAEILPRLGLPHQEIAPASRSTGLKGHAWEQFVLPRLLKGAPLWSPCNTGPIMVRSQVVTVHDAAVADHPEWFSRQFIATYKLLLPQLARSARRIVTVSRFSQARLSAALGIPADRIEVVYNGVSEHFTPPAPDASAAAAAQYGVQPRRYFVTLSTLEPRKNLALTLKAWDAVRSRLPGDIRLLLLGGSGGAQIFAGTGLPADMEGVIRAGFVPDADLPALLGGAIALLYPSRYEGFGLPILEAMACGTPAVTSNTSSLPEVGGAAALYIDPDDAGALADTICTLASDEALRSDLSEAGLAQARLFSWTQAADQMRHILKRDLDLP
jgi:glycosyltransferase involved in cell wall biosynthesis